MFRNRWMAAGVAGVLAVGIAASARQDDPADSASTSKTQDATKPQGPMAGMGELLLKGLKETEGCLGVETAQTSSGKAVIFAWFTDKDSVVAWYDSAMHQRMMGMMTAGSPPDRAPLAEVADGTGPILVVASITFAEKPEIKGFRMPISQIAIELYTPLPGGAAVNGRFAPEAVKVNGLRDYTPKADDAAAPKDGK